MDIDSIISQKISEQVAIALEARLSDMEVKIVNQLSRPEFEKWGRYLSTKQAMIYTGYSSKNGFKELCRLKGIVPSKMNGRVFRYDRYELDKINVQRALKGYVNSL